MSVPLPHIDVIPHTLKVLGCQSIAVRQNNEPARPIARGAA